jgi:hypothetical protein
MSKHSKVRLALIWAGALGCGLILAVLAWPRPTAYWAFSSVVFQPYTNALLARSFETQMIHSIPGLRELTVNPGFATVGAATSWPTNQAATGPGAPVVAHIRLMALGASPAQAKEAADDAANQLCFLVRRQYGCEGSVVMPAARTGRWLFLFELKLRLERFLHVNF